LKRLYLHQWVQIIESRQTSSQKYILNVSLSEIIRRIGWQNSLGNCIVKARFPKMPEARELNVNLCQALVLMCFNVEEGADEDPKYTINDIMKKAGLDDRGEAERILQSLSMGREGTQVLRRIDEKLTNKYFDGTSTTPKKKHKVMRKAISDSDVFIFNSNFFNNQRRIRITNIQMKETAEERSKTQEAVTLDRLHLIDAAIVRIMKARKTLDHASLVGEVMKQLKFPTFSTDIKKRIETLIEREYLERTEGDSSRYNYLA
jgi:cullin-4